MCIACYEQAYNSIIPYLSIAVVLPTFLIFYQHIVRKQKISIEKINNGNISYIHVVKILKNSILHQKRFE